MPVIFANVIGRASGPDAFTQVTLIKARRDEFSGTHICSPSSSPSCLRRLLTLAQPRESTGQTNIRWRQPWCRGLSLESVHNDQPAFPQASLGTGGLFLLWRKQRTGDSSKSLTDTPSCPVPVYYPFGSSSAHKQQFRLQASRSQVSSKWLSSEQLNARFHMVCPNCCIT